LAITRALSKAGARLIVVDNDLETLAGVEAEFSSSPRPFTFHADIRERQSLEEIRDQLEKAGIGLNTLIANAGINVRMAALDIPDEGIRNIIDTNFYGTFITIQTFAPLILKHPPGRIVVNSSAAAVHGMNLRAVYAATKAGLSGLVRCLAIEWGPSGTTVNAVGPGIIRTPLTQQYMDEHPDRLEASLANTPLRRIGEPEDVADVITFLVSDASRFITGQTIYMDGGLTAGSAWW
jgi:gluconate 5-dehydrogenase